MAPLVMTTIGKLGPSVQGFLQNLVDFAYSTGFLDCGSWLRIATQHLSCTLFGGVYCSASLLGVPNCTKRFDMSHVTQGIGIGRNVDSRMSQASICPEKNLRLHTPKVLRWVVQAEHV